MVSKFYGGKCRRHSTRGLNGLLRDLPWCQPQQVAGALRVASAGGTAAGLGYLLTLPPAGLQKLKGRLDAVFQDASLAEAGAWLSSHQSVPCYDVLAGEYAARLRSQPAE